jgi:sodium/potassium/calcium exchanger 6
LAWGNSMADLSANITMARKGLANMAMTACFAGPVFNILVGLGLGFSSLAAQTGVPERNVSLSPSVLAGFVFLTINAACILTAGMVFGKGRIFKPFGYLAISLYIVYVVTSIGLQYSKYGDEE